MVITIILAITVTLGAVAGEDVPLVSAKERTTQMTRHERRSTRERPMPRSTPVRQETSDTGESGNGRVSDQESVTSAAETDDASLKGVR
jgi:hypothetical protein